MSSTGNAEAGFSRQGKLCVSLAETRRPLWWDLKIFGKGVVETVEMFFINDLNGQTAGDAGELIGAGIGHNSDGQLGLEARHNAGVVNHEAAFAAMEISGNVLDGHVHSGAIGRARS